MYLSYIFLIHFFTFFFVIQYNKLVVKSLIFAWFFGRSIFIYVDCRYIAIAECCVDTYIAIAECCVVHTIACMHMTVMDVASTLGNTASEIAVF